MFLSSWISDFGGNPSRAVGRGQVVLGCPNHFGLPKTQLALPAWAENPPSADCCATLAAGSGPTNCGHILAFFLMMQNYPVVIGCKTMVCMTYDVV